MLNQVVSKALRKAPNAVVHSSSGPRRAAVRAALRPSSRTAFARPSQNLRWCESSLIVSKSRHFLTTTKASAVDEAEPAEKDNRVPVTVITGFLGSGKTTLLNRILREGAGGRRIAVIENEFGALDIDGELVARKEVMEGSGDIITTLSNGCLCCSVREDLITVLNELYERRGEFDHIVIETTGLANPAPIISSFYMAPSMPDKMRLDGIVTVIDAKFVTRHLDEKRPGDQVTEAVQQIAYADRIVLNKTDLVSADELEVLRERIATINNMAAVLETTQSLVPVDDVLGIGGYDLDKIEMEVDRTLPPDLSCEDPTCTDPTHDHAHAHAHVDSHDAATCTDPTHNHGHEHENAHDAATCTDPTHDHGHDHEHSHEQAHAHSDSHDAATCTDPTHNHGHEHEHSHDEATCTDPTHNHSHKPAVPLHDDKVASVSFVYDAAFDLDKLNQTLSILLETRETDIFRMKGILAIHNSDYRFVYQVDGLT